MITTVWHFRALAVSQRRLVHSLELSPESRRILNRMRVKGQEWKFRTPQQSGELDVHLPQKKRGEHKRSRRRHNRAAVEGCDPTPAPPPPPPAEVLHAPAASRVENVMVHPEYVRTRVPSFGQTFPHKVGPCQNTEIGKNSRDQLLSRISLLFLVRNDTPGPGVTTALLRVYRARTSLLRLREEGVEQPDLRGRSYTHIHNTQLSHSRTQSSCCQRAALLHSRPLHRPRTQCGANKYTRKWYV